MEHLSTRDSRRLFEALHQLYQWQDYTTFKQQVVRSIATLISADLYAYNEISSSKHLVTGHAIWPNTFPLPQDAPLIVGLYQHQLPCLTHYLATGDGYPTMISDFMSYRAFRRTDLHNQFYRPVGIPYAIAFGVTLQDDGMIGIGLHRSGRDYTERDRRILWELHYHIVQAYSNAQLITRMQDETRAHELVLNEGDVLLACLTSKFRISWATPHAYEALCYYKLLTNRSSDRLHSNIRNWLRAESEQMCSADRVPTPRLPLVIPSERGRLHIRLIQKGIARVLLMTESRHFQAASMLAGLGLSPRETQVLGWVRQAKSNAEIGTILGISFRTVQKHLERIYAKLGVENRATAASIARKGKHFS